MQFAVNTYIPGGSSVHRCDARVKIVLLAAYSVTLFLVRTWTGMAFCAAGFALVLIFSRLPPRRVFSLLGPLYVIVAFMIAFNGFTFDVAAAPTAMDAGGGSAGAFSSFAPLALVGSFGIVPAGFARGCFFALRVVLLMVASLVVSFTTTSTSLADAFLAFLRPLRIVRVPVDDIATVLSLALRFIPVTAEELGRVRDAQWARGATFDGAPLLQRLHAWQTVLVPLFVGLFRRADTLATAMDARCYGAFGVRRTSLSRHHLTTRGVFTLVAGLALCVALSVWT